MPVTVLGGQTVPSRKLYSSAYAQVLVKLQRFGILYRKLFPRHYSYPKNN